MQAEEVQAEKALESSRIGGSNDAQAYGDDASTTTATCDCNATKSTTWST